MSDARLVAALLAATVVAAGCGGGSQGDISREQAAQIRRERAQQRAEQRLERVVSAANDELKRAAAAGDVAALARAERRLSLASRRLDRADRDSEPLPENPVDREFYEVAIQQAPLFIQQVITDGHRMLARVYRAQFCLKTPQARLRAVRRVYDPIDRRLRRKGINDIVIAVSPIESDSEKLADALAIARDGRVILTRHGRSCSQ